MTRAQQINNFWESLALLIKAGLPILRSLNVIINAGAFDGIFKENLIKIRDSLQGGNTFSEAMKESIFFSGIELTTVRDWEKGDILEILVDRIAKGKIMTTAKEFESFWFTLGSLLNSGVQIIQALENSIKVFSNPEIQEQLQTIIDAIERGDNNISGAMKNTDIFSQQEIAMVALGEETGSFDAMCLKIAKTC